MESTTCNGPLIRRFMVNRRLRKKVRKVCGRALLLEAFPLCIPTCSAGLEVAISVAGASSELIPRALIGLFPCGREGDRRRTCRCLSRQNRDIRRFLRRLEDPYYIYSIFRDNSGGEGTDETGWIGGDSIFSVGDVVYFADTLTGSWAGRNTRKAGVVTTNFSFCLPDLCRGTVVFAFNGDYPTSYPAKVKLPAGEETWWPLSGMLKAEREVCMLVQVIPSLRYGTLRVRQRGDSVKFLSQIRPIPAQIQNWNPFGGGPGPPPTAWCSVARRGPYAYLFGFSTPTVLPGHRSLTVLRAEYETFPDSLANCETYGAAGWVRIGTAPPVAAASIPYDGIGGDGTFGEPRFIEGAWYMPVTCWSWDGAGSASISLYRSRDVQGPYTSVATAAVNVSPGGAFLIYLARIHPTLSIPGRSIVFTFGMNTESGVSDAYTLPTWGNMYMPQVAVYSPRTGKIRVANHRFDPPP